MTPTTKASESLEAENAKVHLQCGKCSYRHTKDERRADSMSHTTRCPKCECISYHPLYSTQEEVLHLERENVMLKARVAQLEAFLKGLRLCSCQEDRGHAPWCAIEVVDKALTASTAPPLDDSKDWRTTPPDSQGPWWWQVDGESAPCIVQVMYSGTDGSFFATIGQYGWTEPQQVEDMGGIWMLAEEPEMVPYHEFDAIAAMKGPNS